MPTTRFTITVNRARLDELRRNLPGNMNQAVDDTAEAIRGLASQIAPKDTGALSQSIYVATPHGSDYGQRLASAQALNDAAHGTEEVRAEFVMSLSGIETAYMDVVGVGVHYGIYQEYGTRFMPAQAFMTPSIENERNRFVARMLGIADV